MATDIATLGIKIEASDIKRAASELNKLEKQSGDNEKANKGLSNSFGGLKSAIAAIGVGALLTSVIRTSASFEKMSASLVTVTGSAMNAQLAMDGIIQFATETPYQVSEITDAFIKLKALGLDPSRDSLLSYGNTASAMGKDLNQMIEAVADAATGEFERLKEFGIKSKSEGDKVSFTFQGITKTVGKNADEITKYLGEIGKTQFAGAMEKQMDTIDGSFSNFSDTIDLAIKKLTSESGFNSALKSSVNHLSEFIRELTGTQTISDFDELIKETRETITHFEKQIVKAKNSNVGFFESFIKGDPAGIIRSSENQIAMLNKRLIQFQEQADKLKAKSGGLDAGESKGAVAAAFTGDKDLEKLKSKYGDELRLLAEKQNSELMLIQEAREANKLSEMEAEELRLAMTQEYAEKRTEITRSAASEQQQIESAKTQMMISMAGNVASAAGALLAEMPGKHKTAARAIFLIEKGVAMSQAFVNTQAAAVKALTLDPTGSLSAWVTNLGYTAIGLMGATALAGVGNVGKGSGIGGGSSPSPSSQPDLGSAPPSVNFNNQPERLLRVVFEGYNPHTEAMRSLLMNLSETAKDMGGFTSIVVS